MEAVSRNFVIANAYAVVEICQGICICHVKVWVPLRVLAHRGPQVRRSYTYRAVFLALPGVTIAVLCCFVALNFDEHVTRMKHDI